MHFIAIKEIRLKIAYLPSFESHTWMEWHIIKQTWIYKRKGQIWHSAQLDATINLQKVIN